MLKFLYLSFFIYLLFFYPFSDSAEKKADIVPSSPPLLPALPSLDMYGGGSGSSYDPSPSYPTYPSYYSLTDQYLAAMKTSYARSAGCWPDYSTSGVRYNPYERMRTSYPTPFTYEHLT